MRRLFPWVVTLFFSLSGQFAWAEDGGGLTLAEALQRAEENLEDFGIVDEELNRARLDRDRAWAAIIPSLRASGVFTYSDREISVEDRVLQRRDSLSGSISASMDIVSGPAVAGVVRAYRSTRAAELSNRWGRNELRFEVARAFFSALAAENLVGAAERARQTADEHLEALQARRVAGVAVAVDEERARLEVIEAHEGIIRARNTAASSNDYLAFLIGEEPPLVLTQPPLPESARVTPTVDASDDPSGARTDQLAVRAEVQAVRDSVTQAWLEYLPTLTIAGNYRASQNTGWSGTPHSWQLLLTLDWVIFDGGLRRVNRREQASQLRSSRLRQQRLDREVRREIRQARRDLETALATLRTVTERLQLAQGTRGLVLRQYRGGMATSIEMTDADDTQRRAEVAMVAQELQLALTWLELNRAIGLDPLGEELE